MRQLFVLALLLATRLPVAAQVGAATPQPLAAPAPAADTITAIHRLFAAKRKTCTFVVGGTALVAGTGAITALSQPAPPTSAGFSAGIDGRSITAAGIGIVGAIVVGLELLTLGGWGQRGEAQAIAAFQQHQQLPPRIQRRLKPAYFRP